MPKIIPTIDFELGKKTFTAKKQPYGVLKKLSSLLLNEVRKLTDISRLSDAQALDFLNALLDKPYEALHIMVPEVKQKDVEEAFADEIIEAFEKIFSIQGFERLKNLRTSLSQLTSLGQGVIASDTKEDNSL